MTADFSSLSGVQAPRCGSAMIFSTPTTFSLGKSVTYLPTRPEAMAASMASSSTISARDSLMMRTPSFILENAFASSIWNV